MISKNTESFLVFLEKQIASNNVIVYLEGGHYNSNYGPDDFSINSFHEAIYLSKQIIKKHKKSVKLAFGLLIDNLGLNCSNNNVCDIKTTNNVNELELNQDIEKIISINKIIKRDRFILFNERTTKNRAIDSLKKIKNNKKLIITKRLKVVLSFYIQKMKLAFCLPKRMKTEYQLGAHCY